MTNPVSGGVPEESEPLPGGIVIPHDVGELWTSAAAEKQAFDDTLRSVNDKLSELENSCGQEDSSRLSFHSIGLESGQRTVLIGLTYDELLGQCSHIIVNEEQQNIVERTLDVHYFEFAVAKEAGLVAYDSYLAQKHIDADHWEYDEYEGCALLQKQWDRFDVFRGVDSELFVPEYDPDPTDLSVIWMRGRLEALAGFLAPLSTATHDQGITGTLQ